MLRGNLLPYFLILFLCAARAPRFLSSRVTGEEDCPTRFSLLIPEGKRCVDTVHPLPRVDCFSLSSRLVCRRYQLQPAQCLPFSRHLRLRPALSGAFLIRSGETRNTVLLHLPMEIRFDPCTASVLSSEGRGGRFLRHSRRLCFLLKNHFF